jgi:hypothetical protein
MSNAFRVKNRLNLTPQATEPTGLELGDLWMDAEGTLKRWDGTASQDVGSGGVGSVDIMFADTFDATNISEYTTTGTVAVTDNVLEVIQGKKSLKITHTGGASAERIIPVDIKFRNKNVTFSFDVESNALSGNLTLTVTDNTNTVTLINAESIQPQGSLDTSIKRSVSFIIPDDCEELKYRFNAVSESGKISIIDNVVIELTQTAKLSTTIEVPVVTDWVDAGPITITATTTNPTKATTRQRDSVRWRQVGEDYEVEYRYRADSNAGAVAGSGGYLFSLPAGVEFADDQPLATIYTGTGSATAADVANVSRNSSKIGYGTLAENNVGHTHNSMVIYAVSGNRFQAMGLNGLSTGFIINSGYFSTVANNTVYNFTLKFKGKNLQATLPQEVSLAQAVLKQESDSVLLANGNAGQSITADVTNIPFANVVTSRGSDIVFNGSSVTVQQRGIYSISGSILFASSVDRRLTLYRNNILLASVSEPGTRTNYVFNYEGEFEAGDIISIRSTANGGALFNSTSSHFLNVVKSGSLKQVNVTENQKIEIPTSELRMEGASTRGTGSDAGIVRFDNIAKLRGDAFTIESTAALGTVITMKKKGKLDIGAALYRTGSSQNMFLTLNQSVRTTTPSSILSEILQQAFTTGVDDVLNVNWSGFVNIGDVIRVSTSQAPTGNPANILNLSFQEQEIAVSVTNVLPQFSESDSSVRVDTANGYGSTNTNIRRFSNIRDNIGSDISYVDSATLGGSFTVLSDGLYNISYTENFTGVFIFGITKNASGTVQLSTLLGTSAVLASSVTPANSVSATTSCQAYLLAGDVIRAHTQGEPASANNRTHFTISKVGKPNVTGVDVTPFAKIEYEVTEQLSASAGSSAGSGTALISNFSSLSNSGSILQQSSSRLTATVDCEVSISWTWLADSVASNTVTVSLYKNGALYGQGGNANNQTYVTSAASTALLRAGDYLELYKVGTVAGCSSVRYNVTVTDIRNAYQVIGGGVENTYSARIANNGTATITSQSYPFISSVVRNSVGNVTINFIPGFFTVAPSVIAQYSIAGAGAGDRAAWVVGAITTTSVTIGTEFAGTTLTDTPFEIIVQRQGSDYRTPSKAIGLPQQRIAYLYENIASGAASGSIVASTWTNRRLDQILDSTGLVTSLASNQFTLPVGKYSIDVSGVMYFAGNVVFRLRNITDSTTSFVTSNAFSGGSTVAAPVYGSFEVTLTSPKTFAVQYFADGTGGAGVAYAGQISSGESTRPTLVKIVKVEE